MYFAKKSEYNDIREKSFLQWLDEMEKHDDVAVRCGVKLAREYMQYLKDENEKLRYAYSVFALQMQAMPQFAKKSDTPRELRGRLRRRGLYSDEDMAGITAAFEKAEYSGGANASEAREATAKLCRIIRRNMI